MNRRSNSSHPRVEHGFTLIELLVVIIILGILAGVVVFAVGGIGDRGDRAAYATDVRTIRTAQEAHCAQVGRYASESELVSSGLLSAQSELHGVAPVSGGTCTAAGDATRSGYIVSCDAAATGCGAGGATEVDAGILRVAAAEPHDQSRWGERLVSAGLPPDRGGNIQGGDLDGDGVPDFFTTNTKAVVSGVNLAGRVYAISGADQQVIYSIDPPSPQPAKQFGFYISVPGDVDGDGISDVAVGTDAQDVAGTGGCVFPPPGGETAASPNGCNEGQGIAYVFSGDDGTLLYTLNNPAPQGGPGNSARFGSRIGRAGDVVKADGSPGKDGAAEILVGASNNDVCATAGCLAATSASPQASAGNMACGDVSPVPAGCRRDQGQAFIFNGANGNHVRTLTMPSADYFNGPATGGFIDGITCTSSCGTAGLSVQGPGDIDGDGYEDQLVTAGSWAFFTGAGTGCGRPEPNGCNESQGRMYLFGGQTGSLLARFDLPEPQAGATFGLQDAGPYSPGDVNGDGVNDIYGNGFLHHDPPSDPTGPGAGRGAGWVFDGQSSLAGGQGVMLYKVSDPTPSRGAQWGVSVRTTDFDLDGNIDLYVGSSPHFIGSPVPDQSGGTAVMKGSDGTLLQLLDMPAGDAQAGPVPPVAAGLGSNLGWSVADIGDVNGDGFPDYAAGAPFQDVAVAGTMTRDVGIIMVFRSRNYLDG